MEPPNEFDSGEQVILMLTLSNPQPYTVVEKGFQSQVETLDSFVLEDVEFANDRSHEVYGTVPDRISRLPDEGVKLQFESEVGQLRHPSSQKIASAAELVFFTSEGIFGHNVMWD